MEDEKYLWIEAEVDCDTLTFRYRVEGAICDGGERWDEDVSEWSEKDIIDLAVSVLDCEDQRDLIEVVYL